ncbi:DUF4440 domain-containing protein [Paraburkholderia sp. 1N]|uniref:DUF4440 domain-containing protein n=1 Tax=Paraburkholderia solitsugae TaxID=2675748 RepID=A0ABX2C469_9BURK|nr:nuclear transport factor 2 family protein [Paraburkholderia solitsugae]NPT47812.1 DUF4440 domain-containing protein [Paraburkholderia solitsugae]
MTHHTSTRAPNTPEQVPAAFDVAFNAGDIDSLLGLFTDDATMRMADGENVASGLEALRRQFTELLKAGPHIRNHVRLSLVSGDIALVLVDWTVAVTLRDGQHASQSGTATQVMTRGDDGDGSYGSPTHSEPAWLPSIPTCSIRSRWRPGVYEPARLGPP